jgi:hypothetical protein
MHSDRHENDLRHVLGRRDGGHLSARRDREDFSDRRDDFRARHDGGRFPERRDGARWSDSHDRGESSHRRDRSRSPDRAAVQAAGSAADRAIHRYGPPPFSRRHRGVADADDAVRFACSVLSHGTWWSLANLSKQLYEHMPEMRALLAGPGRTCAATFFESYGFQIRAQPKMDTLIRLQAGSTPPRCQWANDAMLACFGLLHALRGDMETVGALTGKFYRHAVAQKHELERFFRVPKGIGMKAWLSLAQERREGFEVFCIDSMPNDPFVRLSGKLKRRSQFLWWVNDRLLEAEDATMWIAELVREHDRVSPISFAVETIGWDGSLADFFSQCPQFQVKMRYDDFVREERPEIKLLSSAS